MLYWSVIYFFMALIAGLLGMGDFNLMAKSIFDFVFYLFGGAFVLSIAVSLYQIARTKPDNGNLAKYKSLKEKYE